MVEKNCESDYRVGMKPGEVVHIGERKLDKIKIRVIDFDSDNLEEKELDTIEQCVEYKDRETISWINIDGLHNTDAISKLGKYFRLSPLILEDIVNTKQNPKIEEFNNYIFIVTKMIYFDDDNEEVVFEQFSFVLGKSFVLSFQERIGDVFEPVRERMRTANGRIRHRKADYLTYALLDVLVDNYFVVVDKLNNIVNDLEDELMDSPTQDTLKNLYYVKRELLRLSRNIRPVREIASYLYRTETHLTEERNKSYLRDLYDHTIDINETMDMNREMVSGMIDTYISINGNKLNEIMKVLTVMASIFIPLTFIAGIYGMNFDNMPELHTDWGYYIALISMSVIGAGMILYFKRKDWM